MKFLNQIWPKGTLIVAHQKLHNAADPALLRLRPARVAAALSELFPAFRGGAAAADAVLLLPLPLGAPAAENIRAVRRGVFGTCGKEVVALCHFWNLWKTVEL